MTTDNPALNLSQSTTLRFHLTVYFLSYVIPFIIAQPQLVTGTLVNTLLFISAERLRLKNLWPVLILPSLGAVSQGVLFGPLTVFLIYFLPLIWFGNYVQVSLFSLTQAQSYPIRVLTAASAKYLILFLAANLYFRAHLVPQVFITSMGTVQLITACLGGVMAYFVLRLLKRFDQPEKV